jgi:SAM-dependent methyltransferase
VISARVEARLRRLRARSANGLAGIAQRLAPPPSGADLRRRVGGRWDEIGTLQFEFIRDQGLQPDDAMLDLGCGVLRGGLHFVRYLDPGNYYGIDASEDMIAGARKELAQANLESRLAHLRVTEDFDVDFGRPFTFGLAQSVFTHLPWNSIFHALANVSEALQPGGVLFATFFRGPEGPERFTPVVQPAYEGYTPVTTFADANPYHYAPSDFVQIGERLPLRVDDIGDWGHPRGQQMLRFTRV